YFRFWNILKLRLFPIEIACHASKKTGQYQAACCGVSEAKDGMVSFQAISLFTKQKEASANAC
ncbi:MAG: hypothetical protein AABX52_03225, partial [Nanoarchaeota archaeon]